MIIRDMPRHYFIIPKKLAKERKLPMRREIRIVFKSLFGEAVLMFSNNTVLDKDSFLRWRGSLGARIETPQPERICHILGLPLDTHGIGKPEKREGRRAKK